MKDSLNEAMTGVSFDSFYDDFIGKLADMDMTFKDMCNDFESNLRKPIMAGLVADQYKGRIKKLYEQWTDAAKSDNKITESESKKLQEEYQQIIKDALKGREDMIKAFGWTDESSSQNSTKNVSQTVSQDTGEEISGRLTAVYEGELRLENQATLQTQSLNILTVKAEAILSINTETRNIADEIGRYK